MSKTVSHAVALLVLLGLALILVGAVLCVPWLAWIDLIRQQPMGLRFVLTGGTIIGGTILGVVLLAVLGSLAGMLRRKGARR